jgi:hypothetical protein
MLLPYNRGHAGKLLKHDVLQTPEIIQPRSAALHLLPAELHRGGAGGSIGIFYSIAWPARSSVVIPPVCQAPSVVIPQVLCSKVLEASPHNQRKVQLESHINSVAEQFSSAGTH